MKKNGVPLYHGFELNVKLGLNAYSTKPYPPEGFTTKLEGRVYQCLPANAPGKKGPRMMAECQSCGVFFFTSALELHEPSCHRFNRRSYI